MTVKNTRGNTLRGQSNRATYEAFIRDGPPSPNMGRSTTNRTTPPAPPSVGVGQMPPSAGVSKPTEAGGFTLQADALALGTPVVGDTVSFTVSAVDKGIATLAQPILLKNKVPPTL